MAPTDSRIALSVRGESALAGSLGVLLLAFFAANVLIYALGIFLLGLVLAELLLFAVATRGFGPAAFTAERVECSALLPVGGTGFASVHLSSRLPGDFYVDVFDTHPEPLEPVAGSARLTTFWSSGEPLWLAYAVTPRARGRFALGPTVLVAHDTLGFAFRSVALPTPWPVEAISRPAAIGVDEPPRLPSRVLGQTSLSARGAGTDFRDLRDHEPGDELRHVAWTRSGQGRILVREYDRESQQDLLVILDVGRDLGMGVGYRDALERAVEAAGDVLRRSFDAGGRAGIALFHRTVTAFEAPGQGGGHEFRVLRTLAAAEIVPEPSALETVLSYLVPRLHRPTSLLIFSALGGSPEKFAAICGTLQHQGHRLYVLAPDVRAMYPRLDRPSAQTAFTLLVGPEIRRARRAAETLVGAGARVGWFGREGAVSAVNRLYGEGLPRPEGS